MGGEKLTANQDTALPAASLTETKNLVNSTISDAHKGAKFMASDLKDFFLATPMDGNEYMKTHIKNIPQDIIDMYNLQNLVTSGGYVYIRIKKRMYGLKQAGVLAYNNLFNNLREHGYVTIPQTVGLWKHKTLPTTF